MPLPIIHRHTGNAGETPVTAYVVEGLDACVVVDGLLAVSDARALREEVEALGKPLAAVVVTHAHPDHYGGLAELLDGRDDVAVHATAGVAEVIARDDAIKETILRPMFGDEWAAERRFPDTIVDDGAIVGDGDLALRVTDLGPGESPHDSIWQLVADPRVVFSADVAYDRHHCYLADGFHAHWLANIARVRRELPAGATLHPGHGEPCGLEVLDWQEGYITTMLAAVEGADWDDPDAARAAVAARMREYLPSESLSFLMELSIDPLAGELVSA
jgi:glyoxylase-like metal-dependent hydrolase (beta-lactamase superfamily II)